MNPSRTYRKTKHNLPGSWLAAAATVWLALAAVLPARADTAPGEEGKTRTYTLAEKSIQHAKENLLKQVTTLTVSGLRIDSTGYPATSWRC
jgi:hypothetical protein